MRQVRDRVTGWLPLLLGMTLIAGACAPTAPAPAPTSAAPAAAPTTAPAKPTAAPAATPASVAQSAPAAATKPASSGATSAPAAAKPATAQDAVHYMGADREQILLDGAKKEGSVQLYTSGILESATGEIIKKFQDKYGIKVEVYRGNNDDIATRAIQEYAANQHLVDVFETTSQGLLPLQQKNILQDYDSPQLAAFIDDAKIAGKNGTAWTIVRESYHGIGWNTNMISDADAPKTYEDLLNPKWKGQIAVPDNSEETIGAYLQAQGPDYLAKLGAQKIRYMKVAARQLADQVIAGEVPLSINLASAHVADSRAKGAPIQWRPLEPVPTNDGSVALAAQPPHPYAALLLLDFYLSQDAGKSYDKFSYGVPRKDIQSAGTLPASIKRFYPTRVDNYEQQLKVWQKALLDLTTQ